MSKAKSVWLSIGWAILCNVVLALVAGMVVVALGKEADGDNSLSRITGTIILLVSIAFGIYKYNRYNKKTRTNYII